MKKLAHFLILSSVIALASCDRLAQDPQPALPPFKAAASIQDLMTSIVDPSADALWDAVSSETTARGIEEKQPRTDAEWLAVRRHAIALLEAGNLLMMAGRPVTHGGQATEDAHVAGVSNPQQVRHAIDADPATFHASARALQDAAGEALAAIDARSAARLMVAGGKLDQACERCHSVFWYPGAGGPPASWPTPIKRD